MEIDDAKPYLSGGGTHDSDCVRVAVNIRPLITPELMHGCTDCISVIAGEPQVQIGSHAFTFDYVFGNGAIPCGRIYDECVAPLVDALFHGYNGTVLAYGQTGSGKTYTMGTNYNGEENIVGIIPKVVESIFSKVESMKDKTEFFIRVSFIEIFKEEVFDLLDHNPQAVAKVDCPSLAKPTVPARVPIQIRETVHGGITLAGVTEAAVRTKEEMASYLSRGSLARATASTNMNSQSSRSHAIFTISIDQKKIPTGKPNDQLGDDILSAKLHLVDLAGSERAKRTGADGIRLREGIHINKGLLALGNVISALGDDKKRKEGGHVPYRDSKLTRLLQDSLGGNSKTIMIACVSPADTNAEETLNSLKYANRARNIHNKAVINRDPVAAQMQRMRSQIDQLQTELLFYRGDASVPFEELQILKHKVSLLEASNAELQRELQESRVTCGRFSERAIEAQVEKDKLIIKIEALRNGKSWDELEASSDQDVDLVKGYISKIQELEEVIAQHPKLHPKREELPSCMDFDDEAIISRDTYLEGNEDDEELEHCSMQERLDMELKELDKRLEQKEAEMKRFGNADTVVLKQHYEKKVQELEHEKRSLQNEIEVLRRNLSRISSSSDDGAQKLKEDYLQKLNGLETQVSELKKKQETQSQIVRQKQKSDDAAKRLQEDIHRIKCQKVQLQNKIKQESERFRLWKAAREKEVLQLKKEGRRNEYEMHKLLALNQRQKMVLQRKTEEAALAAKRLKDVLEPRKAVSRDAYGAGSSNGHGLQALMQAIEHELEVTVRVHEVRSEYERQKEERAKMAQEVARLKEEDRILRQNAASACPEAMSPGARNSRIFALESMLATSSSALVSMASHLSLAEERERLFSGKGRWNQIRSLSEAKNLMNHLFNLASSSRCKLRDNEVECREKDAEMKELKEKVFKLNTMVRQVEGQNAELIRQLQQRNSNKDFVENANATRVDDGRLYDLRQGPRTSGLFTFGNYMELLEDMDTSDSERSNSGEDTKDDDWVETVRRTRKKSYKNRGCQMSGSNSPKIDVCDDHLKMELSSDLPSDAVEKVAPNLCCTCSKYSFCKTSKCECRSGGGSCSASCGCSSTKCSNRETSASKSTDETLKQKNLGTGSITEVDDTHILVSQGAALLQNALVEMPGVEQNEEKKSRRKPLSDIGNTTGKPNAPKPEQRKRMRKSVIQLVPAHLPPPAQSENSEPTRRPENSLQNADATVKLPMAIRSATFNSNLLRDRNADQQGEHAASKDGDIPPPRANKSEEKENNRQ